MAVGFSNTNKPLNPRGQDASPKGYNRASLYSGKALDFDGVNDVVTTTYTSGFTGAQEFTYCAYVNADTIASTQAIIHGNEVTGWGLQSFRIEANKFIFYAGTGSASTSYVVSETIEANKWYFVVGVHTPTENKIYLNGVLNATAAAANLTTAPQAITIGRYPSGSIPFNGEISNAKIFNTALTAAQVADLYDNPEKVVPTGVADSALKLYLPMMEGAGTTAYDGSGNGNHGTISGATYVNGIGAPVAQTAVIDWNKAENRFSNSENFDDSSGWVFTNVTRVSENNEDPRGTNTAVEISWAANTPSTYFYRGVDITGSPSTIYLKVWAKSATGTNQNFRLFANNVSHFSNDFVATNEWQQFEFNYAYSNTFWGVLPSTANDAANILVAFPHTAADDSPYLTTLTTAQPNKVLLPQGLTTGRDITGVNLFENVRKQGALNLDGNSWAEVHDNESLDITDAITLECWINSTDKDQYHHIISKSTTTSGAYAMVSEVTTGYLGFQSALGAFVKTDYNVMDGNWNHIVVVYDEVNAKFYINGALDDTIAETTAIGTNDIKVHIGARGNGIQLFESDIAQPRIYNRALTASEVLQNYNSGKNTYK
jgi:hypothetical protein